MNSRLLYIITIILLLASFQINCIAQNNIVLKGKVYAENKALEFANVVLYKKGATSKPFRHTITDSLGQFSISDLIQQDYELKISMIGFRDHIDDLKIIKSIDVDKIELLLDSTNTSTLEVFSKRKLIKKTSTGFIVNAKDNLAQATGTATDILRNTPTIVVDEEGNISMRGKSPLILVNGRNSIFSSTQRIPASSIETIEIVNSPSARYDADAESGIINIVLKKNTNKGTNGSIALGGGFGTKARQSNAFLFNHQLNKWNFGLAYDNRVSGRNRRAASERINFNIPDVNKITQNRFDERVEQTHNAKLNIDYAANKKNIFGLEIIANQSGEDNKETLYSNVNKLNNIFNYSNKRFSNEIVREKEIESALTYSKKFDDKRKTFDVSLSSTFDFDKENTDIKTQSLDYNNLNIGIPFLQRTHSYQNSSIHILRADYAFPYAEDGLIELGAKSTLRATNADFQTSNMLNNSYTFNTNASNVFKFNENIHAAYFALKNNYTISSENIIKYELGLRAESTDNNGHAITNNIQFNNQYLKLFPNANISYSFSQDNFIKLDYSKRINRPVLEQLNPFVDITDSLNPHSGNPYLKPELIDAIELGYNYEKKNFSVLTNVFYRYSTNIMRSFIAIKSNGVALSFPQNFGTGITYGVEQLITVKPLKFWNINASFSLFEQKINGSNINTEVQNSYTSWYSKLIQNFDTWKSGKLQIIANYNSPIATPQGTRIAVYNIDLGIQQKLWKGKGALGLVLTDVLDTQKGGITALTKEFKYYRNFKVDTRAIFLTLTYSFKDLFKEELLQNKFSND